MGFRLLKEDGGLLLKEDSGSILIEPTDFVLNLSDSISIAVSIAKSPTTISSDSIAFTESICFGSSLVSTHWISP